MALFKSKYPIDRVSFVLINILVSALSFLKSFVFMKYLGIFDLGVLTIIQTLIMSIGLMQLGFLNGGYRILSISTKLKSEELNDQIFSFFGLLGGILISIWLILLKVKFSISHGIILLGIVVGLLALIQNWLSNALIAKQMFKKLNLFNLVSTISTIILLPLVFFYKLNGAIIILILQPITFLGFSFYFFPEFRPKVFTINKALIRDILKYGFIPFLTGIFTLLTTQIERWSILGWLGTESLGKFYLVFLYSTLYVLIPTSLNSLFFPNTMRLYQEGRFIEIKKEIRKYYSLLLLYNVVICAVTAILLYPFVSWLLPQHIESVKYVYYILPGLALISLIEPVALLFNASVILKPMFWAYLTSVVLFSVLLVFMNIYNNISLSSFACLRSVTGSYVFIFFIISYILFKKVIWSKK